MKKFYWSGISNQERLKAIYELTGIINSYGTILNFLRFSDISIGLSIETEECKVVNLYSDLAGIMFMDEYEKSPSLETNDCLILLNVTFTQGTGDLEIEVPALIE